VKRFRLSVLFLFLPAALPVFGQGKAKPAPLAPPFQEWLKVSSYIIRDKELDVFKKLTNDRDREIFVETFWKMRDPTPPPPENEYKDEIHRRFKEANRRFRYGSVREGWQTDRGRIYIILGEPRSVTPIPGSNELYPAEIWSYYGDADKNMPTHFQLVFFQWRNAGEYKLYDPVVDGPAKLIVQIKDIDPEDYQDLYERIHQIAPDLAQVSLSIIPGEIPYLFRPSPENTIMMANILESPKKAVNESYATHFLDYKGMVSTEYMTNYIESTGSVQVVFDPVSGLPFVEFLVGPRKLSLDFYEPKSEYSCAFELNVSLRAGESLVYQYAKEFPFTVPEAKLAETEAMGVNILDGFPAVPGRYKLSVLLQNKTSKEFTLLEREVEVPSAALGAARIVGPVVGYRLVETQADTRLPFQAGNRRILLDPENTLGAADQVAYLFSVLGLTQEEWRTGSVRVVLQGTKPVNPFQKTLLVRLSDQPYRGLLSVAQSVPAADLPPDFYDLTVTLLDGAGKTAAEGRANFVLSTQKIGSHPVALSRGFSQSNRFVADYILASQFDRLGQAEAAEAAYERALAANPSFTGRVPEFAGFLIRAKKFARALELAERIKDDTRLAYQYRYVRGRALLGLERYEEAAAELQEGNRIYNSDPALLGALGFAYWKTGRAEDARNALAASLKLNPDQPEVKALLAEIQKK
jgi:GWxTD domain-containing protein